MEHRKQKRNVLVTIMLSAFILALSVGVYGCRSTRNGKEMGAKGEQAGQRDDRFKEIPLTTFPTSPEEEEKSIFNRYRIAPGDQLDVLFQANTWRKQDTFTLAVGNIVAVKFVGHSELNQEQSIRPDGTISLPYLKQVHVTGMTVQQLTDELEERYSEVFKDPEVYVVVPEFRNSIKELKKDLHTAPRGLSRLTTVRPDGRATFPMVGDVAVEGRTIPSVKDELDESYSKILPGLSVDLFLNEHSGRKIYVLGAVDKAGSYPVSRPITVAEALALAGSYNPSANLEQVVVMRRRGDKMLGRFLDLSDALRLQEKTEFFYLRPDDIVYVPRRKLSRWATVAREIGDVIFFRGWSLGASATYDLNDDGSDD
ncbi:MAG: polysaccharide biosynthesis/export family protein [Planctomycetota bacterium]